jgi:hypothetical protein
MEQFRAVVSESRVQDMKLGRYRWMIENGVVWEWLGLRLFENGLGLIRLRVTWLECSLGLILKFDIFTWNDFGYRDLHLA